MRRGYQATEASCTRRCYATPLRVEVAHGCHACAENRMSHLSKHVLYAASRSAVDVLPSFAPPPCAGPFHVRGWAGAGEGGGAGSKARRDPERAAGVWGPVSGGGTGSELCLRMGGIPGSGERRCFRAHKSLPFLGVLLSLNTCSPGSGGSAWELRASSGSGLVAGISAGGGGVCEPTGGVSIAGIGTRACSRVPRCRCWSSRCSCCWNAGARTGGIAFRPTPQTKNKKTNKTTNKNNKQQQQQNTHKKC